MLNKQGFGIWSSEPPARGFQFADLTLEVAAGTETRELVSDYEGPATAAGYTVLYVGGEPVKGIAVCDLPGGARTVAVTADPALTSAMTVEEFCGREVVVKAGGELVTAAGT